jgi:hypothetical protein
MCHNVFIIGKHSLIVTVDDLWGEKAAANER